MIDFLDYFQTAGVSEPLENIVLLTSLSILPLLFLAVTCFTRFIIVFSLLRFALGLQQTPPNIILITISLFLTFFAMDSTFTEINKESVAPYVNKQITMKESVLSAEKTLKKFMVTQTREDDLSMVLSLKKTTIPDSLDQVKFFDLVPAFLLSELRTAFKIGFVIFIPFLLVDLIVSSILMSLGMIMLPPVTVSLPIKIMLFVLIDGWKLVAQSLVSSVI